MSNKRGKLNIRNEYCNEMRKVCFLVVSNGYRNTCYNFQIKSDLFNKDVIIPVNGSNNHCIIWQEKIDIHKSKNDILFRFKIQNCIQTMKTAGQLCFIKPCTWLIRMLGADKLTFLAISKWWNSHLS